MHAVMRRVVKPRIGIATRAPTEIATYAKKLSGRERVIIPYTAVARTYTQSLAREKPTTQTARCSVRSIRSASLSYASTRSCQSRMASLTSSMTLSKPKAVRSVLRTTIHSSLHCRSHTHPALAPVLLLVQYLQGAEPRSSGASDGAAVTNWQGYPDRAGIVPQQPE